MGVEAYRCPRCRSVNTLLRHCVHWSVSCRQCEAQGPAADSAQEALQAWQHSDATDVAGESSESNVVAFPGTRTPRPEDTR